ncbi:uncharacterized protein LOC127264322 [Andrographis paniculata]|uniref:uncharacterized protein LOC127264322 n=1 Tax=Andrographis paniculata TaxID=175694 RepID=UPI0021E822BB|nr:uncharacterized protein LOC127264322 [Andrographis paniculata]
MNAEKASSCNFVVNFLLEENYLLSAFELFHELLEDGRDNQAIRLKEFFSDPTHFPHDQISRFSSSLRDPQSLLDEKVLVEDKLAVAEYELRLAQEDILKLEAEVQKKTDSLCINESCVPNAEASMENGPSVNQPVKRNISFSDLGHLKDSERLDINCAVKEYLVSAGYRLTAMTFYEEVTDQDLDARRNSPACMPDALRQYYYHYISSTAEAAEEKIATLRENGKLKKEKQCLLKSKEASYTQITTLTKSLEALKKEVKNKDNKVQSLKKTLKSQRQELNDCRAEITSLKMYIEGSRSGKPLLPDSAQVQSASLESQNEEMKNAQNETEILKTKDSMNVELNGEEKNEGEVRDGENPNVSDSGSMPDSLRVGTKVSEKQVHEETSSPPDQRSPSEKVEEPLTPLTPGDEIGSSENYLKRNGTPSLENYSQSIKSESVVTELSTENMGLGTIQILANALPKIVPYVLINHREELLPLIMCAIERHPDSATRDSLTHTLFNLIKRPDEQQRRIIMNACVTLAKNIGELRTETELLPQCWEQVNHIYEERRVLVAQSCGEIAEFVRPEIRDSLILSIMQQLIEDSATVVREASAHNLALLLPLFPNTEKYFKVEEMMFQLVCDPARTVSETTMKDLVPALINWGNELDHILQVIMSRILGSSRCCPPLSGVEGSIEFHFRALGERQRWTVEVLLRLLSALLGHVYNNVVDTCPFASVLDSAGKALSPPLLELYSGGDNEWLAFEWLHNECFPGLIQLASLLSPKEDNLRHFIARFLLAVTTQFGESYLTHIMLPVFLVAVGNDADLKFFPINSHPKIRDLKPHTTVGQRVATVCILPLLLAGVLGYPSQAEHLTEYLKNLLLQSCAQNDQLAKQDIMNSLHFLCTFEEHHNTMINILWEMVAGTEANFKIYAADLSKILVSYIEAKMASIHVIPALVTLGSDQNLDVKYASIIAFGAVAQHYKNDMIVDKICIQMDAFLEDGSHEATIAVVRALSASVPYTTDKLRNYLLSKIFHLTTSRPYSSMDLQRQREMVNAFCQAIRALDATDLPSSASLKDLLIPTIQNLLKDGDALDPAHKEALEVMLRERSLGTLDPAATTKVPMGLASHLSSFFGESGLLAKTDSGGGSGDPGAPPSDINSNSLSPTPVEDTRFRRIMRGSFSDMLRSKQ